MARVESVGGIATLQRAAVDDADTMNVNVRLFAKLDSGLLAVDPGPQSFNVGTSRQALDELIPTTLLALRWGGLPAAHRQGYWGGVLRDLRETFAVSTDAETLMSLPFDFVPDGELRELITTA